MRKFPKPIVVISKCIEFEPVRWNAQIVSDDFVRIMKKYTNFLPVCPEVEIGLGVPRETLRIVKQNNELRLIQPLSGLDLTDKIKKSEHYKSIQSLAKRFEEKNSSIICRELKTNRRAFAPTLYGMCLISARYYQV